MKILALISLVLLLATSAYAFPIRASQVYKVRNAQGKIIQCAPYRGTYVAGRLVGRRSFTPLGAGITTLERQLARAQRRPNNQRNIERISRLLQALRIKVASDNQSCVRAKLTPTPSATPSVSPTPIGTPSPIATPTPIVTPLPTRLPTPIPTPLPPPSGDAVSLDQLNRSLTVDDVRTFLERVGWGLSSREESFSQIQNVATLVDQFTQTRAEDAGWWEKSTDLLDGVVGETHTTQTPRGQRTALFNMWTHTNNPFAEKLALFLLSTWTVSGDVIGDETFRFAFWDYYQKLRSSAYSQVTMPDLAVALSRDPLMLIYLNNELNLKGNPNENFARELMELFTLGTVDLDGNPNYTETKPDGSGDIAVAARALTGWKVRLNYSVNQLTVSYEQARHEPGPHLMFAATGHQFVAENDEDLIRGIFSYHPNTSIYYAKELLMFYLTPNPSRELIEQFASVIREENFNLRPALVRLFKSKAFYHPIYRDTLPKNANDFAVEVVKLLRLEDSVNLGETDRLFFSSVMPINLAPSVFWFNPAAWTSPSLALERANFVARLLGDTTAQRQPEPDWSPDLVLPTGQLSAAALLAQIASRLGIAQIPANAELQLESYMNRERQWDSSYVNRTYDNTNADLRRKKGLGAYYILFSMPEFVMK